MNILDVRELKRQLRKNKKEISVSKNAFDELSRFTYQIFEFMLAVLTETYNEEYSFYTYRLPLETNTKKAKFMEVFRQKHPESATGRMQVLNDWFLSADETYRSHAVVCTKHTEDTVFVCPKLAGFIFVEKIRNELPQNEYVLFFMLHGLNQIVGWIAEIAGKLLETNALNTLRKEDIAAIIRKKPSLRLLSESTLRCTGTTDEEDTATEELAEGLKEATLDNETLIKVYSDDKIIWVGIPKTAKETLHSFKRTTIQVVPPRKTKPLPSYKTIRV